MNPRLKLPMTRREFIHRLGGGGLGLMAFSSHIPAFLARAAASRAPLAEKDRSILVLIQLAGGNDGLNTVVPHADDNYFKLRPTLALREGLLRLDDLLSLHPACPELQRLYLDGKLAILQNVGYPNPNRSHFRSSEIWETATDSETIGSSGWLGRFFDNTCQGAPDLDRPPGNTPVGVHFGDSIPQAMHGRKSHNTFGLPGNGRIRQRGNRQVDESFQRLLATPVDHPQASFLQHTMMDVLVTEERIRAVLERTPAAGAYGSSRLGRSLQQISTLIHADLETRVYFVSQGGYDTHANQAGNHARLLGELSSALGAFQADLEAKGRADQVLTVTFSEFGRRADENAGRGTDHGAAAPLFVLGSKIIGGLHGTAPKLTERAREVDYSIDFRGVYSEILTHWFDHDPAAVLGQAFQGPRFL